MNLDPYIGRIVRLKKYAFRDRVRLDRNQGASVENCFLVANVNSEMGELTCYGENLRITVCVTDVVRY